MPHNTRDSLRNALRNAFVCVRVRAWREREKERERARAERKGERERERARARARERETTAQIEKAAETSATKKKSVCL
jgi:hypothetical protein